MPFVTTIVFPFIFLFGAYRLVQLISRFRNGKIQLNRQRGIILPLFTILAYLVLAFFTVVICACYAYIILGLFLPKFPLVHILPIFGVVMAYPVIFFAAEWIFFYGLKSYEKVAR
jgi:hypothetical protein